MPGRAQRRTYLPPIPKLNLQPSTLAGAAHDTPAGMGAIQATAVRHSFISSVPLATSACDAQLGGWEASSMLSLSGLLKCRLKSVYQHLRPLSASALRLMVHLPKAAPAGMALAPQAYLLSGLLDATKRHLSSKAAALFGKDQHAPHTGDHAMMSVVLMSHILEERPMYRGLCIGGQKMRSLEHSATMN